jgi:glycosyltransferase involved in cell wall biosynthesis
MQPLTRILELRSVRGTGGGPEKTILLGSARTDAARYAITVCYIRDDRDEVFGIDARAASLALDYVEVREKHSFDFGIWPKLRQLVRERQIDIVHAHDYKTNLYALLLARAENVIPLTTLHGYTGDSWKEQLYYAIDRRMIRFFPRAIAVSGQLRDAVVRAGASRDRIVRILNGIDDRAFVREPARESEARRWLGVPPGAVVIGAVGRVEAQKRFDLLLNAFAELRRRQRALDARLVIAGDGSLLESLRRQRSALDLQDTCLLTGHCEDVARLHHAVDVFVQSSDYEGTPNAVLEAMAFETPIVATDVGGTRELVEHGEHGLVVPPGDAHALANAIEQVLAAPDATRRRAVAARRRVENALSFRARMAAVETVYDELMDVRHGSSRAESASHPPSPLTHL